MKGAGSTVPSGSSPLARGLRINAKTQDARLRIIPARAGFTRRPSQGNRRFQDHPRSRGVYGTIESHAPVPEGSSPLARGLHVLLRSRRHGPVDHPRSRGVYNNSFPGARETIGSSPLARGLPRGPGYFRLPGGIIPARAGFTLHHHGIYSASRDHPRSRGVYRRRKSGWLSFPGSSPLARGLPRR